jgi:ectoine hydroxylase-related dioxygenase (phytanoyl-CoA dioxygenase family)
MSPRRQQVIEVFPSPEEIAAGKLNDANSRLLLEALHIDGLVVLRDIIDPAHLDALNVEMIKDAKRGVEAGVRLNQGGDNMQQGPPLTPTLFFDDIYLNKILFHAMTRYLGQGARWDLVTGNTALPNSTRRQPVHSDADFKHPDCPFYAVAAIPLITAEAATGATEFWLGGTHRGNSHDQEGCCSIRKDLVEARRLIQPPIQPRVQKGSVYIRDLRLWHAGMPNPSDQWRCVISLGFSAAWYKPGLQFRVPKDSGLAERIEEGVKGSGIVSSYREVSHEEYVTSRYALDFSFDEGKEREDKTSGHLKKKLGLKAGTVDNNEMPNVVVNGLSSTTNNAVAA